MADLAGGFRRLVQQVAGGRIRLERLALDDAERGEHAAHLHVLRIDVFVVDEARQHVERAAIGGVEHVDRDIRGVREHHRLGRGGFAEGVDASLLHDLDRPLELLRILEKAAPEHKHAVGAGTVRQVA
ncbi:hypothetical protein D3C78_666380 [compost metagenome]